MQNFQTQTIHTQTQLQSHQSQVNHEQHSQQNGNKQNSKPVNFEKDELIDTGASFSSLMNPKPLHGVVIAKEPMTMGTNAGNKTLTQFGEPGGFKAKMWKDIVGTVNFPSFAELAGQCHVKCDNTVEDAFHMAEWENGDEGIKFNQNCVSNSHHFKFSDECIN